MISGAHVVVYSKDAEADRAFFRDILGLKSVDAGHGWLIFALPPAEVAFHRPMRMVSTNSISCATDFKPRWLHSRRRALSALTFRKHDGVQLRRCGFPVEARSASMSRNIRRP